MISVLRNENYLSPDYPEKAKALYAKYRPIEKDPKISFEEKSRAMEEWWRTHFDLLIKSKLNKKDVEKAVSSSNLVLKEGAAEILDILKSHKIPLIILSSSGLGDEAISWYLKSKGLLFKNTRIISNSFNWDEEGNIISVKEPIVHSLNKKEILIKQFPAISKAVGNKGNIILLGDSLSDADMVDGINYDNLIKIGFLNEDVENQIGDYKEKYDLIITGDSSALPVFELIKQIVEK